MQLPPLAPGRCNNIIIEGQQHAKADVPAEPTPVPPEIAFERDPVNAIVVDEDVRLTHPLVKDAGKELQSRPPATESFRHHGRVDVRVSKASISRALRILQVLFVAFDGRGYCITVKEGENIHHRPGRILPSLSERAASANDPRVDARGTPAAAARCDRQPVRVNAVPRTRVLCRRSVSDQGDGGPQEASAWRSR
jgi:hypothetical protein